MTTINDSVRALEQTLGTLRQELQKISADLQRKEDLETRIIPKVEQALNTMRSIAPPNNDDDDDI